tara:strand:- start:2002 stop:2454 length:453 start_codon:yes stop_codon:yes gene_type:complete
MAKVRKKYNPVESARKTNIAILKGFCIAYFANDEKPKQDIILCDLKGNVKSVTKTMSDAITLFKYKWSVMLVVFCIEKGQKTAKMKLCKFSHPYIQSDLVDYLNKAHQDFIQDMKDKSVNMTGAGWLASAVGRDFNEEETGYIFEKLGAF